MKRNDLSAEGKGLLIPFKVWLVCLKSQLSEDVSKPRCGVLQNSAEGHLEL